MSEENFREAIIDQYNDLYWDEDLVHDMYEAVTGGERSTRFVTSNSASWGYLQIWSFFPSFNHTHECHSHWNMNAFLRYNMTRIKRTVSTKVFIIFLGLESTVLVVNSLEKSFYLKFQQCSYEIETENTADV